MSLSDAVKIAHVIEEAPLRDSVSGIVSGLIKNRTK
jgi:hypothetical protein